MICDELCLCLGLEYLVLFIFKEHQKYQDIVFQKIPWKCQQQNYCNNIKPIVILSKLQHNTTHLEKMRCVSEIIIIHILSSLNYQGANASEQQIEMLEILIMYGKQVYTEKRITNAHWSVLKKKQQLVLSSYLENKLQW